MASVGEPDLAATLDGDSVEGLQTLLENIHHSHSVGEANNYVEARGVEGHAIGFVVELLADFEGGRVGVVPDPDRLVDGASGHEVLFDANVHSLDGSRVEGIN